MHVRALALTVRFQIAVQLVLAAYARQTVKMIHELLIAHPPHPFRCRAITNLYGSMHCQIYKRFLIQVRLLVGTIQVQQRLFRYLP